MPKFTTEELKTKTNEELAILAERNHPLSAEGVLIKEEWERRRSDRKIQPAKSWHETFVGKVIVGVIVGIIVIFATVLITQYIISKPQQPPVPNNSGNTIQNEVIPSNIRHNNYLLAVIIKSLANNRINTDLLRRRVMRGSCVISNF